MIVRHKSTDNKVSPISTEMKRTSSKTVKNTMIKAYETSNQNTGNRLIDRDLVLKALRRMDKKELASISRREYSENLTFYRFVEYLADMLCFYWMVTPSVFSASDITKDVVSTWRDVLSYLEDINPEKLGTKITREALLDGVCYCAVKEKKSGGKYHVGIQFLPLAYCRTTKTFDGRDLVDFNVLYFDNFTKPDKKKEALELYPNCISEKYFEYKSIKKHEAGDEWMTIDPDYAFRFSIRNDEVPFFFGAILDILDLQDTKDMQMFKMEQELSKILIQQFPVDKDGTPQVSMEEMRAYHRDVTNLVEGIPGVDVITTFANISSEDLAPSTTNQTSTNNPTARSYQNVFNAAGISQTLFNAENSGALAKSVIIDESLLYNSILAQFSEFLNTRVRVIFQKGDVKDIRFNVYLPEITYQNRSDMAKLYKEQTSLGFSKFLPAIALGQRQSFILSSMIFENNGLKMRDFMLPPSNSNTMSSSNSSESKDDGEGQVGRPELPEEERSDKTRQNRESL